MSIKIDITPLLKNVGRTLKINDEEKVSYPEDSLYLTAPVKIQGRMTNTGETILFEGKVRTSARQVCGRCLKEYDQPVEFTIEEEFSRTGPPKHSGKKEICLNKKDFVFGVGGDNTIDLSEVLRQDILTELPIRPLCEKCKEEE